MVKGSKKINKDLKIIFDMFKKDILADRKRFNVKDLENYIIKKSGGVSDYAEIGGYQGLYQLLKFEEKAEEVVPIKSSKYTERDPALKTRWSLKSNIEQTWDERTVFKLANRLDLNYYLKRPEFQTARLLDQIKSIYSFLGEKEEREWASREERSLELFGDEKYLSQRAGLKLLNRLHLKLSDIKAEKFSQMFVYWNKGNKIERVLILENHSSFIACKRAIEAGYSIFSYNFDTLIFGEGKHIIKSLKFIEELAELDNLDIRYAGDIDPAGLAIYTSLKEKYPEYNLTLFINYYQEMINQAGQDYTLNTKQQLNKKVLKNILCELMRKNAYSLKEKIEDLWHNNLRIPQEVITYEVLING